MEKKNVRKNGTYVLMGMEGDNPKLMAREHANGRDALYLEFYLGYEKRVNANGRESVRVFRKNQPLDMFLWRAPRDRLEREHNRRVMEKAHSLWWNACEVVRSKGADVAAGGDEKERHEVDFLVWAAKYFSEYHNKDKRLMGYSINCFMEFLLDPEMKELPDTHCPREERETYKENIMPRMRRLHLPFTMLDRKRVEKFTDYLNKRFKGETAHSVYKRFKMIVKAAVDAEIIVRNPCSGVVIRVDRNSLKKDVLSLEEIELLKNVRVPGANDNVRRAFLFCLFSGLRFCDVKELRFSNIDFSNRLLRFDQVKTSGHSSSSVVVIPLNDYHLSLIGQGARDEYIFTLPTHTMCSKALRHWVRAAGIDKHITWHCARHSFAVNLLNRGANIKTVSSLMGHASITMTEKYTRAIDSLKVAAIDSLIPVDRGGESAPEDE